MIYNLSLVGLCPEVVEFSFCDRLADVFFLVEL